MAKQSTKDLLFKIQELQERLEESEQLIGAIKAGEVDAFAIGNNGESEVYTLQSGDYAYRVLIEELEESAINVTEDGLIVYTNPYFFNLLKLPYEKVIGTYIFDFVHPGSRETFRRLFNQSLSGKSKGEINLSVNGMIIPVYVSLTSLQPNLSSVGILITDLTEKKKSELIEANQKELQQLVKQAPVSIALFEGEDLVARVVNEKALIAMGKTEKEVLDKPMQEYFPEVPERKNIYLEVFRTGVPYVGKEVKITFNRFGKPHTAYYDLNYTPWYSPDGKIKGVMTVGVDVTEKVLAREKIQESEWQLAVELSAMQQLQKVSTGLITEQNEAAFQQQLIDAAMLIMNADFASLQMFISKTNELVLLASHNFHPESKEFWQHVDMDSSTSCLLAMDRLQRVIISDAEASEEMANSKDLEHYHLSGIRSVQSTPLMSRDGRFIGVLSTHWKKVHEPTEKELQLFDILARQASDLIERKEQENKLAKMVEERTAELEHANFDLKKAKEHFTLLFQVSPVAKSLTRVTDRMIMDVNPAWEKMFERKKENIIGKTAVEVGLMTSEERAAQVKMVREKGNKIYGNELSFRLQNGKMLHTYLSGTNIVLDGVEYFLTAFFDITERRHAEEQILKAAKELEEKNIELENSQLELLRTNKELESFNYIASHDLQEPLRKIETFIHLMNRNMNDEAALKKYTDKINVASQRMALLIQNVLEYSRISHTAGAFKQTNLNSIIENVKTDYELLIHEKKATISSDPLPSIKAIPVQMQQLFANLISNSLKFSDKNPQIKITAKIISGEKLKFKPGTNPRQKFAEIKFTDNGIGFEPQYAEQIFDLFQRLHGKSEYEGTGVGLSIVKKIVEQHKGYISAASEKNKGAMFTLWLPVE